MQNNKRWYLAEIVVEIRVADELNNVVHIATILLNAYSSEEAYNKAIERAKAEEMSYENPDGKLVTLIAHGLSDLSIIDEELGDGAEITYEEYVGVNAEVLAKHVRHKEQLTLFQPHTPSPGTPNYAAKDIVQAAKDLLNGRPLSK